MTVAAVAALAYSYYHKGRLKSIADPQSKITWEQENVIKLTVKINRNQNPELFDLLQQAESKSGLARDLMNQAIKQNQQK